LISRRAVRTLVINRQVTDSLTGDVRRLAESHRVPVLPVEETMPSGLTYGRWMYETARALSRALARGPA
jgi:zinc/manganese transport system substrate-binding protein